MQKRVTQALPPHHLHPNFDAIFSSLLLVLLPTLEVGSRPHGSGHSLHLRGSGRELHGRDRVLEWINANFGE